MSLQPSSITSRSLAHSKASAIPIDCVSHCLEEDNAMRENELLSFDDTIFFRLPQSRITNVRMLLSNCTWKDIENFRTMLVWDSQDVCKAYLPLPLILLLNRTSVGGRAAHEASHRYSAAFISLRFGLRLPKLVADTIVSFVALADGPLFTRYLAPAGFPCPLEFSERIEQWCNRVGSTDEKQLVERSSKKTKTFLLNAALPLGDCFPLVPVFNMQHRIILRDFDQQCSFRVHVRRNSEAVVASSEFEQTLLSFSDFVHMAPIRLTKSEFAVKMDRFCLPSMAFILNMTLCPNIDTIELCFHWPRPVTSCSPNVRSDESPPLIRPPPYPAGTCHKIVYQVSECTIEGISNWIVLSIDRSLSPIDALHKFNFDIVPDYLDTTRVEHCYLRCKSSAGHAIDMPSHNICIVARQFNTTLYKNGITRELYL